MRRIRTGAVIGLIRGVALGALLGTATFAQGLFEPVARVGDRVVTAYELQQRTRFVEVIGQPGDPAELALEGLIDDRVRQEAAEEAGIDLTDEQVMEGMAEFAGRAGLSTDEFVAGLAQNGVDAATFRDFVAAGLGFREIVRQRLLREVEVDERDVDREIRRLAGDPGLRYAFSRVVYRVDTPQFAAQARSRIDALGSSPSLAAFAAEARQFSVAPEGPAGGLIDAMDAADLPGPLRQLLSGLAPGEVSAPVPLAEGRAVAIFQLREVREAPRPAPAPTAIDYAAFYIPGGRTPQALAEAAAIRARVDTCDDLYPIAREVGQDRLDRGTLPPSQIPADIAQELALLDAGEASTVLTRAGGQTLIFLMLCDREYPLPGEADREAIRAALQNRALDARADALLQTLRAETRIEILP
ncbi:periplasmic chaperone for outer membrane proteins SurA [Hasllibacter halocynthiae]|uniref:Parvulin-like PPIase n=1 Tax=Hasllibacter halocynthiae TaxID=595589 RepID=A0A2T0X7V7_9RHOB|nr:peptidylprolyl isomerase [Hasllibacter halocynthiae]PRY94954.1 periplasmic chaperone for outer membrane proteins SurA [Hasllibacter halocynthiae]